MTEAFRAGGGVPASEYSMDLWEGMERWSAPTYTHNLIENWLPAVPGVVARLRNGGATIDVGCGGGRVSLLIAKAFPRARVFGVDPHPGSIELARSRAKAAGFGDRIRFEVRGGESLRPAGYDPITSFDVFHHVKDPLAFLSSLRKALAPDGTYFMVDIKLPRERQLSSTAYARMIYPTILLYCLTTSLAEGGSGIGADQSDELIREYAAKAGFTRFRVLPIDDPFEAFYELKA